MKKAWLLFIILVIVFICSDVFAEIIVYPRPESANDKRTDYPVELLKLGLAHSGVDYNVRPSDTVMVQGRALHELSKKSSLDVVWSMTSISREKELLPIRIPIYKGLIGWRMLLINETDKLKFQKIKNLSELEKYKAGQGHDWPDTAILEGNGLKVFGCSDYESLFKMLQVNRFDYFPRSIVEIWAEADRYRMSGIVIEETKVIQYPTAFYFFVNKGNQQLASDLEEGLEVAIRNGEFDKLFDAYHDQLINNANLKKRTIFYIDNPILPEQTPLKRKELWFHQ